MLNNLKDIEILLENKPGSLTLMGETLKTGFGGMDERILVKFKISIV